MKPSTSTSKLHSASTRRTPAPKVLLSSRSHIDCLDAGLCSVQGAQEIISTISSRRLVTKLILGHNDLGDEGCIVLFKFLGSAVGRKYPIAEISLNSNGIGDQGLLAIAEYLKHNFTLKVLFLQNNPLAGDPSTVSSFTSALNSSGLELLSLTSNHTLSDSFIEHFLPTLDSLHLREMLLSAIGLTSRAAPHIIEYISSHRCRLHTIKLNGNGLGFRAVRSIVRAIERRNFALSTVELYSNCATGPQSSDNTSEEEDGDEGLDSHAGLEAWKENDKLLKRVLLRNEHLKKVVEKEALQLLRYSRTLLLRPKTSEPNPTPEKTSLLNPCCDTCSCVPLSETPSAGRSSLPARAISIGFSFTNLPIELQLYTLSFLAPTLSSAQRIRIYTYASSLSTLPRLFLCLPSTSGLGITGNKMCIPDPSSLPFGGSGGKGWGGAGVGGGCANGKCMGARNSVLCHREEERVKWLAAVRCWSFEPEKDGYGCEALA